MKNTSGRYKKSYIIALTLLALLTISTQLFIQFLLYNQKEDAHIINISGRQRMLSQKITKQALLLINSQDKKSFLFTQKSLKESLDTWDTFHQALQNGDENLGLKNTKPNIIISKLFDEIELYQKSILKSGLDLLNTKFTDSISLKEDVVDNIVNSEGIFLRLMDEITYEYEQESNRKTQNLAVIERTLMLITLVILMLEALLIFRPITKKIKTTVDDLEQAKKAIEEEKNLLKQSLADIKINKVAQKRNIANLEITQKALVKQKNSIENQKVLLELSESVSKAASFDFHFLNHKLNVSENARKLLKIRSTQRITLELIFDFLKPDSLVKFTGYLSELIEQKGEILEGVYQAKFPQQNQWLDYQLLGKVFYNSEQKPIRILGSVRNITEQISKQRELENTYEKLETKQYELQNAYNLLEKSSEAARIGSWEIDLKADKINWSKVSREIHEIGHDFLSMNGIVSATEKWLEFYQSEENQNKIEQALHSCLKQGLQFDIETQIVTIKGQEKWIRVIGIPAFQEGKIIRLYGLFQDIDERKKNEAELTKLALIARKTDNLVVVTDNDGRIEWVNNSFTKLSGYSLKDVVGKRPSQVLQGVDTNPEHKHKIREGLDRKESFSQEILNYTKDGNPYWIDLNITPVLDSEDNITQYIAIEQDITERKKAEQEIEIKNKQLQIMLDTVEDQKDNILASIEYAKRIQTAIFSKKEEIESELSEILLFYQPKDIVSGDFYWFTQNDDISYWAIADCTGHGVPGAFMTIIGMSLLEQVINKEGMSQPAKILQELDERMSNTLQQQGFINEEVIDGMEISFFKLNKKKMELTWASAKRPLWLFREQKLISYKGNPYSIAGSKFYIDKKFEEQCISLEKGDKLYTFTDGYADQLGGQKNRKLMMHHFRSLVMKTHNQTFDIQEEVLKEYLLKWQGKKEQTDDILIFGMQV